MPIDWWTLGLQTVNLLVLLWLLGRFFFRPLARIIADRQAEADRLLSEAAAERGKAQDSAKSIEAEKQAIETARAGLLEKARGEAEAQRAALLESARGEAESLRKEAQSAIASERGEEEARAGHRATLLAADIAARLLQRVSGQIPLTGFLPGFGEAIASLPASARTAIGADGKPLSISLAQAPSDDERAQIDQTLAHALRCKVEIAIRVDPALIAGISLETPNAVVSNNLRADLDRVAAELTDHGG